MKTTAEKCTFGSCRRTTTDPTRRCHDHRSGAATVSSPGGIPLAPTSAVSDHLEELAQPRVRRVHFDDGTVSHEEWKLDGRAHREDGPATTSFHRDGSPRRESWALHGQAHRIDGPAETEWDENGDPTSINYIVNGYMHRLDGPAVQQYRDGHMIHSGYIFRGSSVDGLPGIASRLNSLPEEQVREYLTDSALRPLVEEGHEPREIVRALSSGIGTVDGLREVIGGAPAEWVRAYEESKA